MVGNFNNDATSLAGLTINQKPRDSFPNVLPRNIATAGHGMRQKNIQ